MHAHVHAYTYAYTHAHAHVYAGSGMFARRYGCFNASSTVIRRSGSKSSNRTTRSKNSAFVGFVNGMISRRLFRPLTNFRLDLDTVGFGKSILLPLKNSGFFSLRHVSVTSSFPRASQTRTHLPRSIITLGILPMTTSIMARCSRLSCVWNRASPVKNSTRMQPIENMSHGYDQGRPVKVSSSLDITKLPTHPE